MVKYTKKTEYNARKTTHSVFMAENGLESPRPNEIGYIVTDEIDSESWYTEEDFEKTFQIVRAEMPFSTEVGALYQESFAHEIRRKALSMIQRINNG